MLYEEWFDEDLKNKKHFEDPLFFYEQYSYKVYTSENNLRLEIKVIEKELISNNYLKKSSEKYTSLTHKKFSLIHKIPKSKLKFSIKKNLIYIFLALYYSWFFNVFYFLT